MNIIRHILLAGIIAFSAPLLQAQTHAITESGDEVLLFEDGTWRYTNDSIAENNYIPLNETPFTKDKAASFLVKSKKGNIGVWIDPKSWSFSKGTDNNHPITGLYR